VLRPDGSFGHCLKRTPALSAGKLLKLVLVSPLGVALLLAGCGTTKVIVRENTRTVTTATTITQRLPAPRSPSGLSRFGSLVWNLEALLHDTFGDSTFYLETGGRGEADFNTQFEGACCSGSYNFTFSKAEHSRFRTIANPQSPPRPSIGASGSELPLTIKHEYISCGQEKWLLIHFGNGLANWQIDCSSAY
jgi:hypothetical protein